MFVPTNMNSFVLNGGDLENTGKEPYTKQEYLMQKKVLDSETPNRWWTPKLFPEILLISIEDIFLSLAWVIYFSCRKTPASRRPGCNSAAAMLAWKQTAELSDP